jgi:hypothetical protein
MSFSVDVISLILYCIQQLGVVLGVGAQTVLLISFLIATRDGSIGEKEEKFGRTLVYILKLGLFFIIVSGVMITLMHLSSEEYSIIETPAFLFKWALIGVIGAVTFIVGRRPFAHFFWEGMLGANWYALFVIHVLAPLAAWADLLVLYALWSIGFILAWSALVYGMRAKHERGPTPHGKDIAPEPKPIIKSAPAPIKPAPFVPPPPKPVPPPPPPPKPVLAAALPQKPAALTPPPLPVVIQTAVAVSTPAVPVPKKPVLAVPQKPVEDPDAHVGLPTIRVMPQTPQEVERQMRASVVQFEQ